MSPTEPAIREQWMAIGLSTEPADRPRAEAAVRRAYRRAGLPDAVRMIWAGSPMGGAAIAESLSSRASGPRATAEVVNIATHQVTRRASRSIGHELVTRIAGAVSHPLAARVTDQIWRPINQQVAPHVTQPIAIPEYGQHDAAQLAFFAALGQNGLDVSELDAVMEVAQCCGWWWPFDDVCVLTDRCAVLACDERGRLHAPDGPAVVYPDGWTIYAWHGVAVQAAAILRPELITVGEIQGEANVEVRRVLLERYGFDRYVANTGAMPIHADETGTLYRCEMAGDEPLVVVSVLNSTTDGDGSRARYVLRVPPDMTEARQAVAWTFGLRPDEYRPVRES
jgi:hypothetical protein